MPDDAELHGARTEDQTSRLGPRRSWLRLSRASLRFAIAPAIVVSCAAVGVGLYINQRDTLRHEYSTGDSKAANRVDLAVTVRQVDVTNGRLVLSLEPHPTGRLANDDGDPTKRLLIGTSSTATPELTFARGQPLTQRTVQASLGDGSTTDYPFDHYTTVVGFSASADGRDVPLHVDLREADPFFLTKVKTTGTLSLAVFDEIRVSRSRGTLILAWFMMIAMWALALSVLGGAYVLTMRRQGMVWPALGWMAATLFALVGMRNAAPGSPPIGSLMDYASFFWAEAIVAGALTFVAVRGIRQERSALRASDRERP